jgi:hypothetical protein
MEPMENNLGEPHYGGASVVINPEQPFEDQAATWIHEAIEAVNEHYNVKLRHKQIELLERGLYEVLRTSRGKLNQPAKRTPSTTQE